MFDVNWDEYMYIYRDINKCENIVIYYYTLANTHQLKRSKDHQKIKRNRQWCRTTKINF